MAFGTTINAVPGVYQTLNTDAKTASVNGGNGLLTVADGAHGGDHFYMDCPDWTDGHVLEIREQRSAPAATGTGAKVYVIGFNKDKSQAWICPSSKNFAVESVTFGVSAFGRDATNGYSDVHQVHTDGAHSILVIVSVVSAPSAGTATIEGRFIRTVRS